MTRTGQSEPRTAPLVAALERAWDVIRKRHPDVPPVVLIVASGSAGRRGVALGHFAASRWHREGDTAGIHEVQISGEGLPEGATDVLGTLLHEAAHALAVARGVKDTSRQGRYHNRRFKRLAEELGLRIEEDPKIGWSTTIVPPATAELYADTLRDLTDAITVHRRRELPPGAAGGAASNNPLRAVCGCGRGIRVAGSVLALGPIVCSLCATPFRPPAEAAGPDLEPAAETSERAA